MDAVRDVSFSIAPGEVFAFLGPNGAGKTTTIKMSAGLIYPDKGTVVIGGFDLRRQHDAASRQLGAVLEGSRNLYWRLTVMENLLYWGTVRRLPVKEARQRAWELLEMVDLTDRARSTVQTLSRGMQQKVALCQALMHRPRLLLLDEPTLGLDYEAGEAIKQTVRELAAEGVAILLTTHQLDVAQELSHRLGIIRHGELVLHGTTSTVLEAYSQPTFAVEAFEPWTPQILEQLAHIGKEVQIIDNLTLVYTPASGNMDAVYDLLALLAPHPIRRLERHQADLAEVFQKVLAEGASA